MHKGGHNMNDELISKKELLEITGISYGQLYRWKRKNLIPEDWFIKKASFTGQETFFPRDKVLERIEKIKNFKDDISLDELAGMLSPTLADIALTPEELISKNIVTETALNIYTSFHGKITSASFEEILYLLVLEKFLSSGEAGIEEAQSIVRMLEDNYAEFKGESCEVVLIRKFGTGVSFIISEPNKFCLEKETKLVYRVSISKCIEELKTKLLNE